MRDVIQQVEDWLAEDAPVPPEFGRPEVIEILRKYYAGLDNT